MNAPRHNVDVDLSNVDGNAFAIMGAVTTAMKSAGIEREHIDAYRNDAMSGDYDHLLRVTMSTVNVQ